MRLNKLAALILTGTLTAATLAGCGINKNATVATMTDAKVSLGVANFMCMYQQASLDEAYRSYNDDVWNTDLFGMGSTMEESVKDDVMNTLHNMYTLKQHMSEYDVEITDKEKASITQAAKDFLDSNGRSAINELGATEDIIEEVLTLYTIQSKMKDAFMDKVEVTDEEANMRAYTMVSIDYKTSTDDEGNETELSDEEAASLKETAEAIQKAVKKGTDLETAATENGQTTTNGTYDADDDTLDEAVKTALDGLKEGETTKLITTDTEYVIARLDAETDEEATEDNRKTIREEKYDEQLEKWQENDGWTVEDSQLAKIKFRNKFKTKNNNTEDSAEDVEYETEDEGDLTEPAADTESE